MKIFLPLKFKYSWLFLPSLLLFLYGSQALFGLYIFNDEIASRFFNILILGLFSYVFSYLVFRNYFGGKVSLERLTLFSEKSTDLWIKLFSAMYFSLIIYALLSSQKIAFLESIRGGTAQDIAFARELFLKERTSSDAFMIYINSILSTAFMPYVIVLCYLKKTPYRHLLLSIFVVSFLPSLEKGLAIKAFLPLFILSFNGYISRRLGYFLAFCMMFSILVVTVLTKMGATAEGSQNQYVAGKVLVEEIDRVQKVERNTQNEEEKSRELKELNRLSDGIHYQELKINKYSPLGIGNQGLFLANRILWIPYITAYDWLDFFQKKMRSRYLYGQTSLAVSILTGVPQFEIEKKVFVYQYGAEGPKTASANTVFLVDGFVNFGWFGVVLFSVIVAGLTFIFDQFKSPAIKACNYYFAYQLSTGALFGVLFSDGLLILLIFVIFISPPNCNSSCENDR